MDYKLEYSMDSIESKEINELIKELGNYVIELDEKRESDDKFLSFFALLFFTNKDYILSSINIPTHLQSRVTDALIYSQEKLCNITTESDYNAILSRLKLSYSTYNKFFDKILGELNDKLSLNSKSYFEGEFIMYKGLKLLLDSSENKVIKKLGSELSSYIYGLYDNESSSTDTKIRSLIALLVINRMTHILGYIDIPTYLLDMLSYLRDYLFDVLNSNNEDTPNINYKTILNIVGISEYTYNRFHNLVLSELSNKLSSDSQSYLTKNYHGL